MKVKDLIRLLSVAEQDAEVLIEVPRKGEAGIVGVTVSSFEDGPDDQIFSNITITTKKI